MKHGSLVQTVVISIIFFVVLFFVSYLGSMSPDEGGIIIEPVYVFIALIPFVILLIASGKLKEIKGPGGIALLMKDEAEREISLDIEDNTLEIDPEVVHGKAGLGELEYMIKESPPTALSFVLEKKNYYGNYAIEEYLAVLGRLSNFRNIVFVTNDGKFSGYMNIEDFKRVVEEGRVVEELESASIMLRKSMHKDSVKISSSNREALSVMEEADINELAVVSSSDKFIGIINQEQIVRKILSRIVREA